MIMPPQDTDSSHQPGQFDFILKDGPKAPKQYPWSSLPKPVVFIAGLSLLLIIGILLFSLVSGNRVNVSDQLVDVMARAQEISRVSDLAVTQASSSDTISLAKTTSSTLNSQKQQISKYLSTHNIKINAKQLAGWLDKSTDTKLETAAQNNNFDQTYLAYLKSNLTSYNSTLNSVYQKSSKTLQPILKDDFTSTQQLLAAPQFK